MNTTVYLTADEATIFERLPSSVREGWTVEREEGTAYEDVEVLRIRAGMARFESYPALAAAAAGIVRTGTVDATLLRDMPEEMVPELCFTIGARGLSALVVSLLGNVQTDRDVQWLAGMTQIRHQMLETNASISYVNQ